MAWNVPTHRPRLPTRIRSQSSLSTRSRSSPAALFVKVTATMRRGSAPSRDQARQPVGDDARLAGAGARDDQQRPRWVHHRLGLCRVQLARQRLCRERPSLRRGVLLRVALPRDVRLRLHARYFVTSALPAASGTTAFQVAVMCRRSRSSAMRAMTSASGSSPRMRRSHGCVLASSGSMSTSTIGVSGINAWTDGRVGQADGVGRGDHDEPRVQQDVRDLAEAAHQL